MSRIGKQHITIPQGTEVSVADGVVVVKGKGGELRRKLNPAINVVVANETVEVNPTSSTLEARALWGTFSSHIKNMVAGVNEPFEKKLVIEGIGYKVNLQGDTMVLDVGFSHSIEVKIPEGVSVSVEKNEVTISGSDKEKVGQFAADVRAIKKPEPYKGKGIRYYDEVVRRKEGKRAVA
jgi:large subunit ribosomal protein L6